MKRKKLLSKISLILCLSLIFTACTPKDKPSSNESSGNQSSESQSTSSENTKPDNSSNEENSIKLFYDDGLGAHELTVTKPDIMDKLTGYINDLAVSDYEGDPVIFGNGDGILINLSTNLDGKTESYSFTNIPNKNFYLTKIVNENGDNVWYDSKPEAFEYIASLLGIKTDSSSPNQKPTENSSQTQSKPQQESKPTENNSSQESSSQTQTNSSYDKWGQKGLDIKKVGIDKGAAAYLHDNENRISYLDNNVFISEMSNNAAVIHTDLLLSYGKEGNHIGKNIMPNVFYDIINTDQEQYRITFHESGIHIKMYSPKLDKEFEQKIELPYDVYDDILDNVRKSMNRQPKNGKIQWLSMSVKDHVTDITVQSPEGKSHTYKYDSKNKNTFYNVFDLINCEVTHARSPEGKTRLPNASKATVKFINGLYYNIYVNRENVLVYASDINTYILYDVVNSKSQNIYSDLSKGIVNKDHVGNESDYNPVSLTWWQKGLSDDALTYPDGYYGSVVKSNHNLYNNTKKLSFHQGCSGIFNNDNENSRFMNLLLGNLTPVEDEADLGEPIYQNYFCEINNKHDDKYSIDFYEKGVYIQEALKGSGTGNQQAFFVNKNAYDKIISRLKYRIHECEQLEKGRVQWLDMMKPSRITSFKVISEDRRRYHDYVNDLKTNENIEHTRAYQDTKNIYVKACRQTDAKKLVNSVKVEIDFNNDLHFDVYVNNTQLLIYANDIDTALIYDIDTRWNTGSQIKEIFEKHAAGR